MRKINHTFISDTHTSEISKFPSSQTHLLCVLVARMRSNVSWTRMQTAVCAYLLTMERSWGKKMLFTQPWVKVSRQIFKFWKEKYLEGSKIKFYLQCSGLLFVKNSWEEWPGRIMTRLQTSLNISSRINHLRLSMERRPFPICGSMKICHCFFLKMAQFHLSMHCNA